MSGLNEGDEGINDGLMGEEAAVGVLLACSVVNQDAGTKTLGVASISRVLG